MKKIAIVVCALVMGLCLGVIYPEDIIPKVYSSDSFRVEEYSVTKGNLDTIFVQIRKKRKKWRNVPDQESYIKNINKRIVPLGYKLSKKQGNAGYDFYEKKDLIESGLYKIKKFSMNKSCTLFVFFAEQKTDQGFQGLFVKDNQVKKMKRFSKPYMNTFFYKFFPFYIDDDLISCQVTDKGQAQWKGYIRSSSKIIYEFSFLYGAGGMPIKFYQAGGKWVLQIDQSHFLKEGITYKCRVILNGQDLCQKFNHANMWCYHLIGGKPFFIFTRHQDSKFRMSYNGKEIPLCWYDYIGSNGTMDIQVYDTMVCFDALRGNQRYYVEAGVFE